MNIRQMDDKLMSMKNRYRIRTLIFILTPILLFSSCNALKRGDFMRQADDSLFFSEIGFRVTDNPGLSRDAITAVAGTDRNIEIVVPYDADTTSPLVISFKLVAKDAYVGYWIGPGEDDFAACESGITGLVFNSGASPETQRLRIYKDSFNPDGGDVRTEDFEISVNKIITPRLYSAPEEGDVAPFSIATGNPFIVAFVDEDGTPLPNMDSFGVWNTDYMYLGWDGGRMHITNIFNPLPPPDYLEPLYTSGPPAGYQLDVVPIYPGEHRIEVYDGLYRDNNGYSSQFGELIYDYSPPPVYLSQSGSDTNNGLTKTTPVKTWTKATAVADTYAIMDIYIEASAIPYDTATPGGYIIDGLTRPMNIFGSWMPGFNSRYTDDWDTRPPTILTNSEQGNGTDELNPSAVLIFQDIPDTNVLDGIQLSGGSNVEFGTALLLRNSQPRIAEMAFQAPQGSGTDGTAVTITAGSGPRINGSRFLGKAGGSGLSAGIRVDSSMADVNGCLVLSGDISGESIGILAANSDVYLNYSFVLSGVLDPDNDANTETVNHGIRAFDSFVNLNHAWLHAWDADLSEAANYEDNVGREIWIEGSTLISGRGGTSHGMNVFSPSTTANVHMFNSVVMAGKSTLDASSGLRLENVGFTQIMNNAINVKDGVTSTDTFGIEFIGAGVPSVDIRNNLIWSERTDSFLAIRSDSPIDSETFHNNNFWDTDGKAEVRLDGTDRSVPDAHGTFPNFYGNVNLAVPVDLSFDYPTEEFDVGRINGTVPVDVKFGGEDLSSSGIWVPEFPGFNDAEKFDRDSDYSPPIRTGNANVGWSMGPYEYDGGSMPATIYVAMSTDGGDDGHPLGTADAPFSSLARAYDIARTAPGGSVRFDVMEIHIAAGQYDMDNPNMPDINTSTGITIEGGWNTAFSNRNISANESLLFRDTALPVLTFNQINVGNDTVLDGFTLESRTGSLNTLLVDDNARPTISRNKIIGNNTGAAVSYGAYVTNNAAPILDNNGIIGGNGGLNYGIYIENNAYPQIYNNTVNGGSNGSTYGIYMVDTGGVELTDNNIHGGSGGDTRGVYVENTWNNISRNQIYGGDSTGNTIGLDMLNTSSTVEENTITGGTGINSRGVYLSNSGIFGRSNQISAGTGSTAATGMEIFNSANLDLRRNTISGGAGPTTYGIYISGGGFRQIQGNTIYGGDAATSSHGVRMMAAFDTRLVNNFIHAGGEANSDVQGISIVDGNNQTYLYNNTVFGGRSLAGTSAGINISGNAAPHIINNIFVSGIGNTPITAYGVFQNSGIKPSRFLNNLILGLDPASVPYRGNGIDWMDAPAIEAYLVPEPAMNNLVNMSDNPDFYFRDFIPGNDEPEYISEDWRLNGSGIENAPYGGLDLSVDAFNPFNYDVDEQIRTAPWSIGAYEF